MKNRPFTNGALAASVTLAGAAAAVEKISLDDFISRIKTADDQVRGPAWQNAVTFGASAVKPLAEVMVHPDFEISRAAKRALWKIVRHAGRPGAATERKTVARELVSLLGGGNPNTRCEALWMLSEIGGDEAVPAVATLLTRQEAREDARATLQRVPGEKSLAALKAALANAPQDYKPALAVSLRVRGEKINNYPSQKLVPTKRTEVKPCSTA